MHLSQVKGTFPNILSFKHPIPIYYHFKLHQSQSKPVPSIFLLQNLLITTTSSFALHFFAFILWSLLLFLFGPEQDHHANHHNEKENYDFFEVNLDIEGRVQSVWHILFGLFHLLRDYVFGMLCRRILGSVRIAFSAMLFLGLLTDYLQVLSFFFYLLLRSSSFLLTLQFEEIDVDYTSGFFDVEWFAQSSRYVERRRGRTFINRWKMRFCLLNERSRSLFLFFFLLVMWGYLGSCVGDLWVWRDVF